MAKRSDFQKVLRPRRKKSFLEIFGNIIIWTSPIFILLVTLICNWHSIINSNPIVKIDLIFLILSFLVLLVYFKFAKRKIHDIIIEKNINQEKAKPLLRFSNCILALMPFIFGYLLIRFLSQLQQPLESFLLVLLLFQLAGQSLLFIDSFHEADYED